MEPVFYSSNRFDKMGINGISCVKAVEYENVKADIDVQIQYEDENAQETIPDNIITYTSYLAVVPGQVLNDLYLEFGSRLLEGNVRSFLSARGKVNKSIQNTIKNYPEMFFAYNNGIAATATEIDTEMTQVLSDKVRETILSSIPLKRGGTVEDIANTVSFLASEKASYITGQVIQVNGGMG